jgi:MoxR-like ATPase
MRSHINENSIDALNALQDRVNSIIRGKKGAVKLALSTLLARGHLLIEDVPGVGKTTLAFCMAKAIDCGFQRIQFTSDLMPSDITGISIFNADDNKFEFKFGPVFTNIVLADEINRTTPKTQSALLEAMNERRVSVDRETHVLDEPFMVIATQNPMEYRGTFPLPESQLDRFMLHLTLGYPPQDEEKKVLLNHRDFSDIEALGPVVHAQDILRMQDEVERVTVEDSVLDYLMRIISATRAHERIALGASTRGAQSLMMISKAFAYCSGRDFVLPDDIKHVAPYVLGHRIGLKRQGNMTEAAALIEEILQAIAVPL